MTNNELVTIARALRVAMGYESREVRIDQLRNSPYLDVRVLAQELTKANLLTDSSVNEMIHFGQRR